jgi:hypothetical protein
MLDSDRLHQMRMLRRKVAELNSTVIADLTPFLNPYGNNTFERLPSKKPADQHDIGVTVTCTCLMTLALTHGFERLYGKQEKADLTELLDKVFENLLHRPN